MRSIRYAIYMSIGLHFLRRCLRKSLTQPAKVKPKKADNGDLGWSEVQSAIDRMVMGEMVRYAQEHDGNLPKNDEEFRSMVLHDMNRNCVTIQELKDSLTVYHVDVRPKVSVKAVNVKCKVSR